MENNLQNDGSLISDCALCGSTNITFFGTLFDSPLANNLFSNQLDSENATKYPLGLAQCQECNHIQLSFAVKPDKLFSNYSYKTGFSTAFRDHFRRYAEGLVLHT